MKTVFYFWRKLQRGLFAIAEHLVISYFGYLAAFSNVGGSKWSNVLNDSKFRIFNPPPPVKIREGVGEISIPIVEALPTTEPPKYTGPDLTGGRPGAQFT